ncbi:MAG: response regulator [Chloroflexi bacterium]|nr:response regulator [Chloroflexota bacterium]
MEKKIHVLIVEDEFLAALYLQGELIQLGYTVSDPIATGEEAIERTEREQPDVILMDIRLAGTIDGIEAAREIISRHTIPIIFMTGYSDDETKERAQRLQPAAYLIKPFQIYQIESAINSAVTMITEHAEEE